MDVKLLQQAKITTIQSQSFEEEDNVVEKALNDYLESHPNHTIVDFSFSAPSGNSYYEIVIRYID